MSSKSGTVLAALDPPKAWLWLVEAVAVIAGRTGQRCRSSQKEIKGGVLVVVRRVDVLRTWPNFALPSWVATGVVHRLLTDTADARASKLTRHSSARRQARPWLALSQGGGGSCKRIWQALRSSPTDFCFASAWAAAQFADAYFSATGQLAEVADSRPLTPSLSLLFKHPLQLRNSSITLTLPSFAVSEARECWRITGTGILHKTRNCLSRGYTRVLHRLAALLRSLSQGKSRERRVVRTDVHEALRLLRRGAHQGARKRRSPPGPSR